MQTLNDIKSLLAAHGLRPKHRLGQNFLHDQNHMRRIVEHAAIEPGDCVLEVGAGTGSLSEALLDAGARLVAVEIDTDLAPILRDRFAPYGDRARLYIGDVLTGKHTLNPDVIGLLQSRPATRNASASTAPISNTQSPVPNPFKLIANLPYQIASPLLIDLALDHPAMQNAVVMVQSEVADRLVAAPGSKTYGPLSVLVQAMCEAQRMERLPASCFWPQPRVASAVVRLQRRPSPLTDDPHRLAQLVQRLFQQRRKQLGSILGRDTAWPAGIDSRDRPERLSVNQLAVLAREQA